MIIIYKNPDSSLAFIYPTNECLLLYPIDIIAQKDVPSGLPFWTINESEIPEDMTFFGALEIPADYREPDGYGSQFNTFEEIENAQDKQ